MCNLYGIVFEMNNYHPSLSARRNYPDADTAKQMNDTQAKQSGSKGYDAKNLLATLAAFRNPETLKTWGIIKEGKQLNKGAFNLITQGTGSSTVLNQENKLIPNEIIIASSTGLDDDKRSCDIKSSLQLLQAEEISSPFITINLFYNNQIRIQEKATKDLLHLIRDAKLTEQQTKEIVTQIILAVELLHKKHIVHRDIKPENFLCTVYPNGKIRVQIADLDGIRKVTPQGYLESPKPFGERMYIPTDLQQHYDVFVHSHDPRKQQYARRRLQEYDFRKADRFAIGVICQRMGLMDLADILQNEKNDIKQAKDSSFFGENEDTRKAFFESIEQQAKAEEKYYDSYYFKTTPAMNDSFMLLPDYLKEIYQQIENIVINMNSIENRLDSTVSFEEYDSFKKQLEYTIAAFNTTIATKAMPVDLATLLKTATVCLTQMRSQVENQIDNLPNIVAIKKRNQIAACVANSYNQYLKQLELNKHQWTFFRNSESDNQEEKKTARQFMRKINSCNELDGMMEELNRFVSNSQHRSGRDSFKRILQDSLHRQFPQVAQQRL